MGSLYVVCELGSEVVRVMLGTLHEGELAISEVRRFENQLIHEKHSVCWNIPQLYQEVLDGLRTIGSYDEAITSISCHSNTADYLLFAPDGSLLSPTFHQSDTRTQKSFDKFLAAVGSDLIYEETGVHGIPGNLLFQLAAEPSRRLGKAGHLLPMADAFNSFLSDMPRIEMSLASATQLFNPETRTWSPKLLEALELPENLLPTIVPSGTVLGDLRADLAKDTKIDGAKVVASCSYQLSAALAGLPICKGEKWAFLQLGSPTMVGIDMGRPLINEATREMKFTHLLGAGGTTALYKTSVGLFILEECRKYWRERETGLDGDLLTHLAISAPAFEAFINPHDPRFATPGDMPLKVQSFCRETEQTVPRKPGPIIRCVLESLALTYRQTLRELEYLTDTQVTKLYILGGGDEDLLNHFIANALEVPTVVAPTESAVIGNVSVQALALKQLKSLDQARDAVRNSLRPETIIPHASAWHAAYDRLADIMLCGADTPGTSA